MDLRSPHIGRRVALALFIAATLGLGPSCSLFYEYHVEGEGFDFYCDRSPVELAPTVSFVDRCVTALSTLFGGDDDLPPAPQIFYEEPAFQSAGVYAPEAPEGYYLPFLRMVHLSPRDLPDDAQLAERLPIVYSTEAVILHELCHHYLIHRYPRLNSTYWLNEGLACLLELGYFDERGQLQLPLFHPWLHEQARIAALELGPDGLEREVRRLVETGWFGFHQRQNRTRNYALSTSMVRVLLRDLRGDLPERIAQLVALDDADVIDRLSRGLHTELLRPNPEHLFAIWTTSEHHEWALVQWVEWVTAHPRRVDAYWVQSILEWIHSPNPTRSAAGHVAAARLLGRAMLSRSVASELTRHVGLALVWEPWLLRAILPELADAGVAGRLYVPTVDLLAGHDADVRVAAAHALSRWGGKPTVTRPEFWTRGDPEARDEEIDEWRRWLVDQRLSPRDDDSPDVRISPAHWHPEASAGTPERRGASK